MMLLGWESNTSIWQKSAKIEGGNLNLAVRLPTLGMKHCTSAGILFVGFSFMISNGAIEENLMGCICG